MGSCFGAVRQRQTGGGELFRGGEAAVDRRWGVVSGRRGGAGFGRWWLAAQGVQVEDELQALPKLSHVKCLSATIAFSFDNNIHIPR